MVQHMTFQDVQVPVPGFGAMGLSMAYGKADDEESMKTLQKAIDLGCTFWDSAVLYGSGHNEQLIGKFFKKTGTRDQVFFASKCGLECIGKPWTEMTITNSAAHINEYIDGTIERLGSAPDLYYLHRIDPDTPLEESIGALDKVRKEGKCKYIGLSECGVETLRKASAIAKIDAIQIEYSPWCTEGEETGLIDAARELGVAVIGYSPLSRGFLSGKYRKQEDFAEDDFRRTIPRFNAENMPKNLELLEKFESLAAKKGTSPTKLALAWVMAQGVIPIPGTKTSDRLEENFSSRDVELRDDEVKEIRRLVDESKPHGTRYDAGHMQTLGK